MNQGPSEKGGLRFMVSDNGVLLKWIHHPYDV